jgi:hypothetical protein
MKNLFVGGVLMKVGNTANTKLSAAFTILSLGYLFIGQGDPGSNVVFALTLIMGFMLLLVEQVYERLAFIPWAIYAFLLGVWAAADLRFGNFWTALSFAAVVGLISGFLKWRIDLVVGLMLGYWCMIGILVLGAGFAVYPIRDAFGARGFLFSMSAWWAHMLIAWFYWYVTRESPEIRRMRRLKKLREELNKLDAKS